MINTWDEYRAEVVSMMRQLDTQKISFIEALDRIDEANQQEIVPKRLHQDILNFVSEIDGDKMGFLELLEVLSDETVSMWEVDQWMLSPPK